MSKGELIESFVCLTKKGVCRRRDALGCWPLSIAQFLSWAFTNSLGTLTQRPMMIFGEVIIIKARSVLCVHLYQCCLVGGWLKCFNFWEFWHISFFIGLKAWCRTTTWHKLIMGGIFFQIQPLQDAIVISTSRITILGFYAKSSYVHIELSCLHSVFMFQCNFTRVFFFYHLSYLLHIPCLWFKKGS